MTRNSSLYNDFHAFRNHSQLVGAHEANPTAYQLIENFLREGIQQRQNIQTMHVDRSLSALRCGSDPQRMIQEVYDKVQEYANYPFTTIGGNYETWNLIYEGLNYAFRDSSQDTETKR